MLLDITLCFHMIIILLLKLPSAHCDRNCSGFLEHCESLNKFIVMCLPADFHFSFFWFSLRIAPGFESCWIVGGGGGGRKKKIKQKKKTIV